MFIFVTSFSLPGLIFLVKLISADENDVFGGDQGECPKLTPEEILDAPPGCNIHTYQGCGSWTSPKFTYPSDMFSYIVCDLQYICVLVQESYMMSSWNVVEEQIEEATLNDPACNGFDLDGRIVGKNANDHHWLYCSQKDNCVKVGEDNFYNCGTKTISSDTNITFTNMVKFYGKEVTNGKISFGSKKQMVDVPVVCTWDTSLYRSTPMGWDGNSITIRLINNFNNTGEFSVFLRLYEDSDFTDWYKMPPKLSLDEDLFIGAGLTTTNQLESGLMPKIKHLWISRSADPTIMEDTVIFVNDFCQQLDNIDILSNGVGNLSKVKAEIVAYRNVLRL